MKGSLHLILEKLKKISNSNGTVILFIFSAGRLDFLKNFYQWLYTQPDSRVTLPLQPKVRQSVCLAF